MKLINFNTSIVALLVLISTGCLFMTKANAQDDVNTFVQEVIDNHRIVIFSKSYCPFCQKAKATIAKYAFADPMILELDKHSNGRKIQDVLHSKTGRRTVPNVFIGGKSIGGSDEVIRLHESGQLETLIRDAGIGKHEEL